MTNPMNAIAVSDADGEKAFQKFENLLMKVQRGSSFRARGAELRAAKKAYQDYLPILQPIGQAMLDRAVKALDDIRTRLKLPPGYMFLDHYKERLEREFIAGQFQLNESASLSIRPEGELTDESFMAEIRIFTRKVDVFVPMWVGRGPVSGRDIRAFGDRPSMRAETYNALAEKIVVAVQGALDQYQVRLSTMEASL